MSYIKIPNRFTEVLGFMLMFELVRGLIPLLLATIALAFALAPNDAGVAVAVLVAIILTSFYYLTAFGISGLVLAPLIKRLPERIRTSEYVAVLDADVRMQLWMLNGLFSITGGETGEIPDKWQIQELINSLQQRVNLTDTPPSEVKRG